MITTARSHDPEDSEKFHFIGADLSRADEVSKVVTQINGRFGGVDLLINNMGANHAPAGGFSVLSDEDWDKTCKSTCWLRYDWTGPCFQP